VHHFCLLIGYGAGAINPYVAFETIADMHRQGMFPRTYKDGEKEKEFTFEVAKKNYIKAANKGIIKVASKMGISTVQSYRGAQIFEAICIGKSVIDKYFTNTASRINGVGVEIIAAESLARHRKGFPPIEVDQETLDLCGQYQWRKGAEYHMWNPDTVAKLQHSTRINSFATFKEFTKLVNDEARN